VLLAVSLQRQTFSTEIFSVCFLSRLTCDRAGDRGKCLIKNLFIKMKSLKITLGTLVGLVAIALGAFYYSSNPFLARANPGFYSYSPCYTDGLSSSTSTVNWMSQGRATSTIGNSTLCDTTAGNNTVPKTLNLTIQHAASSSPQSIVNIYVQTSMDGKQWSQEVYKTFTSATATTSREFINPGFYRTYQQVATSTDVLSGNSSATTTVTIQIPNPDRARYFKVLFTVPVSSQPSNIWAELRPVKETN